MSLSEKKKWILLIYSVILYLSLIYIKKLFLFYNMDFAYILSSVILYGGIVYLIIVLYVSYYLKKKYATPNTVILGEPQILIPFRIMLVLGIGIPIMGFINS